MVQQLREQLPLSTRPSTAAAGAEPFETASSRQSEEGDNETEAIAPTAPQSQRIRSCKAVVSSSKPYATASPTSGERSRPAGGSTQQHLQKSRSHTDTICSPARAGLKIHQHALASSASSSSCAQRLGGARSSLYSPVPSHEATAHWLASKARQQQEAAAAAQKELQKERQQLAKLQDKQQAALTAHSQVGDTAVLSYAI